MKAVNLLPDGERARARSAGRPVRSYALLGVLGALLVAVLAYGLAARQVEERTQAIASAGAERQRAEARAGELAELAALAENKEARVRSVKELAGARRDWERFARELGRVLPHKVRLTQLAAAAAEDAAPGAAPTAAAGAPASSATGPQVTLGGCAPSQPDVAKTLVRLRRLSGAREVTLTSSKREETEGSSPAGDSAGAAGAAECEAVAFEAKVAIGPRSLTDGRGDGSVPAELGGGA